MEFTFEKRVTVNKHVLNKKILLYIRRKYYRKKIRERGIWMKGKSVILYMVVGVPIVVQW